ncbi:cytosolic carboxypeptidase 1-like isoform X2 [Anneissia japonica]|uniref:cytosolic carboxypeptidase 1-like isoform X2 n=1 Tax=Anneissia japonica TaxID=1529436 RepID=UPI00142561C8|nr:cytosolic carboxypeptidase 1-like isoform X2 [Anneissia japonica]
MERTMSSPREVVAPPRRRKRKRRVVKKKGLLQKIFKTVIEFDARACGILQTLEKLNSQSSDDVEQIRYLTARLQVLIRDQEKVRKDVVSKTSNGLSILLATLESSKDTQVSINIVQCFLELLHSGKRASLLVSNGATQILLNMLCSTSQQLPVNEELMKMLHQVLAKIGPKDRKFGVKARLCGALSITLGIIRTHTSSFSVLLPCLLVLKVYTTNAVNCSYLGKSGAVSVMLKIITICNRKQHHVMKHALDTLGHLVKSKSNSARAIGQGGMTVLLSTYMEWHKGDTRQRHVNIRKGILVSLKHVTTLKSGRKAFIEADGIKIMYAAAKEMSEMCVPGKDLESLTTSISVILRKCFPRNRLPVPTIKSCVPFSLPESPTMKKVEDVITGDDVIDESDDGDDDLSSEEETSKEPEEASLIDKADVPDLDSSPVKKLATSDQRCLCKDCLQLEIEVDCSLYTCKRSSQDLQMYSEFFPELVEFEEIITADDSVEKSNQEMREEGADIAPTPIVIPTGSVEITEVQSSESVLKNKQNGMGTKQFEEKRLSLPNLPKYQNPHVSEDDTMDHTLINGSRLEKSSRSTTATSRSAKPSNMSPLSDPVNGRVSTFVQRGKQSKSIKSTKGRKSPVKMRKLSKSLPLLKHLSPERQISRAKSDPCANQSFDTIASSMIVSRMSLRSPEKQDRPFESALGYSNDINMNICPEMYFKLAESTKSVLPMNKLSYSDVHGHVSPSFSEQCNEKQSNIQKSLVFEDIDRLINPEEIIDHVVYDLDSIMTGDESTLNANPLSPKLTQVANGTANGLKFNSLFECGNLRKAIWVRQHEYDLILNSDVNSNHHHQWFYFEVSNMKPGVLYRFNIVNCEKPNSQFNFGMQPVMYSVKEAMQGRPSWKRSGTNICYYRNHFSRSSAATGGQKGKSYFTLSFSISFQDEDDICYLAYHYPYSYTMLQAHLWKLESNLGEFSNIYYKRQKLCLTIGGNVCPVLTITANPLTFDKDGIQQFRNRPYIFLSARVHPGESNASWVMKGSLMFLLSSHPIAQALRETYIFKVVPMLNPDGVINGNHRCSLTGEDLNRRWISPNPELHPTIYHTKGLLQYLTNIKRQPLVFCDFHGHSRKKNVFMYGCSALQSYLSDDINLYPLGDNIEDTSYKTLPRMLSQMAPPFSLSSCSFTVEKGKESTARVVVWREIGVLRSYTMESTYCGCDQGPYKGLQISTAMLEEMGQKFCESLMKLKQHHTSKTTHIQPVYQYILTSSEKEDDSLEDTPLSPPTPTPSARDIAADEDDLSLDEDGDESDNEEEDDAAVVGIPIDTTKPKSSPTNRNEYSS